MSSLYQNDIKCPMAGPMRPGGILTTQTDLSPKLLYTMIHKMLVMETIDRLLHVF